MKGKKVFVMLPLLAIAASFLGAAPKPVTLSLWNSSQSMVDWYNEIIPGFLKQNPDVEKVEISYLPIQDFVKRLAVVLPAGDVPDIMEIEDSWATPYTVAGYFDANPPSLNSIVDKMDPNLKKALSMKGKTYGVPVTQFHEIMFYNMDILKAAGINKIPDTLSEIISAAVKTTKRDASGKIEISGFSMRLGGNPSGTTQKFWVLALLGNGTNLWEESTKQPGKYHAAFDNEAGYNALKLYIDLLYKYKIDDFASVKDTEAFFKGKTAINMREPSASTAIFKNGPNVNWVTGPMPIGTKQRATFRISLNLYLPKDGKNKDQARKFIEYALRRDLQEGQVKTRGSTTPYADFDYRGKLVKQLEGGFTFPKNMKIYYVPMHSAYDTIQVKLGEALPQIFKKAELLDNPEGIKREVKYLANLVNEAYKEFEEYGE